MSEHEKHKEPAEAFVFCFEEWMETAEPFVIAPGKSTEVQGFLNFVRIDRNTLPNGWYAYDIRHGSNGGFCTIENKVTSNHGGTFVTKTPITFPKGESYKYLTCGYL